MESGFSDEASHVTAFRRAVLEGDWDTAEKGLMMLGVPDGDSLRVWTLWQALVLRTNDSLFRLPVFLSLSRYILSILKLAELLMRS